MNRIVVIVVVALLAGAVWWFFSGGDGAVRQAGDRGVAGEPMNITLDFYEPWMVALRATNTDPYTLDLHNGKQVSEDLSRKLWQFKEENPDAILDPVICQVAVPSGLRTLPVFEQDDKAQFLVLSAEKGLSGQAVVTLEADGDYWQITDITCGNAEEDPNQGEFSFEREGFLLKNVPEPLDSQYWHLVFEEKGIMGHTAPLFLSDTSVCVENGSETVCDSSSFSEAKRVKVQGAMSESGVSVDRIEFIQ